MKEAAGGAFRRKAPPDPLKGAGGEEAGPPERRGRGDAGCPERRRKASTDRRKGGGGGQGSVLFEGRDNQKERARGVCRGPSPGWVGYSFGVLPSWAASFSGTPVMAIFRASFGAAGASFGSVTFSTPFS